MGGFLLGIDAGSSSIKTCMIHAESGRTVASSAYPSREMEIISLKPGWAEQHPQTWWENLKKSLILLSRKTRKEFREIAAIGISYQMHGLVIVDKKLEVLRPSIIWCDSRSVGIGQEALQALGEKTCYEMLLNSPGNFTASKLKWVKDHELGIFKRIYKMMLPGDFLAMKMTGEIVTTVSGLSEGILWNFRDSQLALMVLEHYGLDESLVPRTVLAFSEQGRLTPEAARYLGLKTGIPLSYRAGDQPNNAFSLNVLNPGEVAATAGTSGVIYGITDKPDYDPQSRVNTFVHVNYDAQDPRYGVLLCINGTGILNRWMKDLGDGNTYVKMNRQALSSPIGADGLVVMPFGNGAERVLGNRDPGAAILGLNFNIHRKQDLFRASQEGIAFALKYGFDVMEGMGMKLKLIRAGQTNMFLSPLFREAFVNVTGTSVELFNTDGSQGAARGAGVGAGIYKDFPEAFTGLKTLMRIEPDKNKSGRYQAAYYTWLKYLNQTLL